MTASILKYFEYRYLPERLADVSKEFAIVRAKLEDRPGPGMTAGGGGSGGKSANDGGGGGGASIGGGFAGCGFSDGQVTIVRRGADD